MDSEARFTQDYSELAKSLHYPEIWKAMIVEPLEAMDSETGKLVA